jgi:16S rRNA (guanine527-N7)-methyltransferase
VETHVTWDDERLDAYAHLIVEWSRRIELVGRGDLDRFRERHIEDSLRAVPLLASLPAGPVVDVGSGAGLPGVPLAIASPDRHFRLLEPRRKRAAFLDEVVRTLDLDCEVLTMTAAAAAQTPGLAAAHVVATARALAAPEAALALLTPLVRSGGAAVLWHGPGAELPGNAEEWDDGIAIVRR